MIENHLKLAPQCRMMKICGIDIIGNPDTNTIIGLNEEGVALIHHLEQTSEINVSCLNDNQVLLLSELSKNGFFTESEFTFDMYSTYFHITSHCNLNCPGCYSFEKDRNAVINLSINELKQILDNLVKAGLTHMVISGGEPFIRDDLEDFLAYARSIQQIKYIECITNGTAALNKYIEASKYLDKLTFSLDSATAESAMIWPANIFNIITEKLITLQSKNIPVSVVFTIHHGNVSHCDDLISFAHSMNVEYRFSILTVEAFRGTTSPLILTANDCQVFHDFIVGHQGNISIEDGAVGDDIGCLISCSAGKTMVAVASDGTIYPCHMFIGKKQFAMGNALRDDIKTIVNSKQYNQFFGLNVDCIKHCKGCNVRYICGGGCRFRAYAISGDLCGADPLCKTFLANKEAGIQRLLLSSF